MSDLIKPGGRFKSVACETGVMVVKAPDEALEVFCRFMSSDLSRQDVLSPSGGL